jgi:kinesin family protein 15
LLTLLVNKWVLQGSSNGFSSPITSRITFVDLAGPETDELDGAASIHKGGNTS